MLQLEKKQTEAFIQKYFITVKFPVEAMVQIFQNLLTCTIDSIYRMHYVQHDRYADRLALVKLVQHEVSQRVTMACKC